ncbi:MAG: PVC-type heme-binding CxxCH protein, partial [Limisphaerales bacterium]
MGKPGMAEDQRTPITAGIWRYHPTKKVFEVFAEGTSNPWGFDFDEHGQLIEEACVIPHLFHMIQGGRYQRQGGEHFAINRDEISRNEKFRDKNGKPVFPYVYDDIKTIADHVHWAGDKGPHAGNSRSASAGGGHAHAGLLIYQGDNWPDKYRGKIFMNNIHGACINEDILERKGSGFVGHHAPNPINFNDSWSQIINLQTGPDGAVYMIDWYDKNQCHHNDANGHDRSNGRIFRISYGETKFQKFDLQKKTNEELVKLVPLKNEWLSRHARKILQERYHGFEKHLIAAFSNSNTNEPDKQIEAIHSYEKITFAFTNEFARSPDPEARLRIIWALNSYPSFTDEWRQMAIRDKDEFVRAWGIQLSVEGHSPSSLKHLSEAFTHLVREDKSPVVRLYLASALQRLPAENRWEILTTLNSHSEDANDQNIPLMVWYASEPLVALNTKRALQMAEKSTLPNILNFTVRRAAALGTPEAMAEIVESLKRVTDDKHRLDILNGLSLALKGQRSAPIPRGWNEVEEKFSENSNSEIRAQVQSLSLTFGSSAALASLKKTLQDQKADLNARRTALDSLLNTKEKDLAPLLQKLLNEPVLRGAALKGLATYDEAKTPAKILAIYNSLNSSEKRDALNTLCSRANFAQPLLAAVNENKISAKDLSADLIRQLRNLKNAELDEQIQKVWGAFRDTSADKKAAIKKYKKIYHAGGSQPGDASRGRTVFSKACQQCHTLFDVGGKVGPDLTGSNRADLDYILLNIVDPNAVIPNDYRASTLETKDDRVLTGIIKKQDEKSVTILTPNETVTIPRNEIASLKQNELSMMPEGLMDALGEQEVRDLIY